MMPRVQASLVRSRSLLFSCAVALGASCGGGSENGTSTTAPGPTPPAATTPPAAPTGLTATSTSASSIALAWTRNSSNENGFQVERSNGNAAFNLVATTASGVSAFVDAGLAASTTYGYRVRAMGAGGTSAYSNVATLKTPDNGIVGSYKLTGPGVTSGTDVGVPFSPYQQQGYTLTVTGGSFTVRSDFSYSLHVLMTVVSGGKSTNVTWDASGTYSLVGGDAQFSKPAPAGNDLQFLTWVSILNEIIAYLSPPVSIVSLPNGLEADMTFTFSKQ